MTTQTAPLFSSLALAGLPMRWSICLACEGEGRHAKAMGSFTATEFAEAFDADERADYFAGAMDRSCEDCRGSGKVRQPDVDAMTFAQKRRLVSARRDARIEAQIASEAAAERRALGC